MKQALKKESRTFVSNPFLPSSTSFPAPLTTHDINLLFLLLEEPHQQHKEDPNHSASSSTPSSTHHTSSMTEVDDQQKLLIIPPEPSCHHTAAATFDLCLKSKTRDQKDSSSPSHLPGATRKSVFDSKDHIMCYEEHKVDETQNRTKRQRSPFLHQQDDTFGYHPGIYSYKSGDIIDNDAHCDDSTKNKRQCLELDHDYAARKEKDAVPSESTLSDTTPYATSTSVSTVNRKSSSKSFNSSSRTGSIQDIKRLESVSPSIPPPRASGGVESSSRETVVLAEQIWKEEPAAPKGKKVDITNLENLEESSPLRTDLHSSSLRADCWQGGAVSSGDRNTSLFSRGTHVSLDPSISVKESQSSQNTFPSHNSGDRGESGTKCTTASDVSSSVHKGRLDYAQEGKEVTTKKMHLVATSSHKAPAVDSWQAFMDKHQEIDEPENSEQIQGEAVPSSYNWEDSARSNTYPYHHIHERHEEGPSAYQANYSHPPRQHHQSPNPYFRENHHTSNSNKQQNNHSGKPTAPLNYYHSTATGNPTSNKYSHRQYHSNTVRPNYRDYPPQHPDNQSYANNPISRPGSRPNSGDHSCTTTNHSYPPVPPLNEAHYLNDNGELMYNSYYPSHQIATNAEGEGRQINHASTTNREQEGADIHNVYAHHQYDHSQYYGRHANAILPNARTTSGSPSSLSSSFTNSQQKQLSEALQPYYNRHILALSTNDDENWLSEFLCFVRSQCVEVFSASRDDVASRMNSKKVLLGQVGIRCRFCAHLPHRERTGRSSSFPSSINRIYQSLTMMLRDHFTKCSAMPQQMNERYLCLKANASQGATDSKKYWIESAHTLGLTDTEDGIRFHHHTAGANTGVPSGDLDRSSL